MSTKFETHVMSGIIPVADAFAGTVATDILENQGEGILFIRYDGAGAVGTSVVTVLACDDTTPSNTTAVPFKYRVSTTPDTWGAWTDVANTGFTTTAGATQLYQIWAAAEAQAATGYAYVKAVFTESANDPVTGCVVALLIGGRFKEAPESYID